MARQEGRSPRQGGAEGGTADPAGIFGGQALAVAARDEVAGSEDRARPQVPGRDEPELEGAGRPLLVRGRAALDAIAQHRLGPPDGSHHLRELARLGREAVVGPGKASVQGEVLLDRAGAQRHRGHGRGRPQGVVRKSAGSPNMRLSVPMTRRFTFSGGAVLGRSAAARCGRCRPSCTRHGPPDVPVGAVPGGHQQGLPRRREADRGGWPGSAGTRS